MRSRTAVGQLPKETPVGACRNQSLAIAKAIPPSAPTMTTRSGGARQTVRSTKPTSATPKSPGVLTELVQTGLYRAAPSTPTTAALMPRMRAGALTKRLPERQGAEQDQDAGKKDADQSQHRAGDAVRRRFDDCPEIGREREQRAGNRLRGAIAGEESIVANPAGANKSLAQQRQHDMAAAENERAGSIKG